MIEIMGLILDTHSTCQAFYQVQNLKMNMNDDDTEQCAWGLNKTTDSICWYEYYYFAGDIFQYTSLYENIYIQITMYRCMSPMVRLIMTQHWLAPIRWQAIIWTRDGIVYWRICASLCVSEFRLSHYYLSQRFWCFWHSHDHRKVV